MTIGRKTFQERHIEEEVVGFVDLTVHQGIEAEQGNVSFTQEELVLGIEETLIVERTLKN